jgi:hypothetical protein
MTTPGDPVSRSDPEHGEPHWQRQHWQPHQSQPDYGRPDYGRFAFGQTPQYVAPTYEGQTYEPVTYPGLSQYGTPEYATSQPDEAQWGRDPGGSEPAPPLYGGVQLYGRPAPDTYGRHSYGQDTPDVDSYGGQHYSDADLLAAPRSSRLPVVVGSVIALVLLAVAGVVIWKLTDQTDPTPIAITTTGHAPTSSTSARAATSTSAPVGAVARRPEVHPPHDGSPGLVAGPTFGPADQVYHMDLGGIPFKFDVPLNWSCMPSSKMAAQFLSAWTCYDSNAQGGAGGLVAVQNCPTPCGPADQAKLRALLPVPAAVWRSTDPATMYGEESGTLTDGANKGEQVSRVAMTYTFAANSGGPVDTMAFAQFTGPPNSKPDMQKVVNDIRVRVAG